jgi:hypothetical protein
VPVNGTLSAVTIVLALAVAVWAVVATVRDRPPDRGQILGLAVVEASIVALLGAAAASVATGQRPASTVTFVGYVVTILCLPLLGAILARLEPTRWGSGVVAVVCLTVPVLVLRLQQTWSAVTGG